jgi:hypothetical protein
MRRGAGAASATAASARRSTGRVPASSFMLTQQRTCAQKKSGSMRTPAACFSRSVSRAPPPSLAGERPFLRRFASASAVTHAGTLPYFDLHHFSNINQLN